MTTIKKEIPPIVIPPLTFEGMPAMVQMMYQEIITLRDDFQAFRMQQPVMENPIDGTELRLRLNISPPTEIRMRQRGNLPYLEIGGNYRYLWQDVLTALKNRRPTKKVTTKNK